MYSRVTARDNLELRLCGHPQRVLSIPVSPRQGLAELDIPPHIYQHCIHTVQEVVSYVSRLVSS